MDSIKTTFSPACPSLPFVPKGLIESKVRPMDFFNTASVLLLHPITFVPKGLMDTNGCPIDSCNTAFSPACPSHHFCP